MGIMEYAEREARDNPGIRPSRAVKEAAEKVTTYYASEDPQVFYSQRGAAILTDQRAVEVYTSAEGIITQMRYLHEEGWEELRL